MYFHVLKLTLIAIDKRQPLLFHIGDRRSHDLTLVEQMDLKVLPKNSRIYGDAAYLD